MIKETKEAILQSVPGGLNLDEDQLDSFIRHYRGCYGHKPRTSIGDLDRVLIIAPDPHAPLWLIVMGGPMAVLRASENLVQAQSETWEDYLYIPGPDSQSIKECLKKWVSWRPEHKFQPSDLDWLYKEWGFNAFDRVESMANDLPYCWTWVTSSDFFPSTEIDGKKRYSVAITENVIQRLVEMGYLVIKDHLIIGAAVGLHCDVELVQERIEWYEILGQNLSRIRHELIWKEELASFLGFNTEA